MKKMITLFLIFCSVSFAKKDDHVQQANRILSEYAKEMKTKYNLFAFGTGGALMDDVKILDFDFTTSKTLSVPEARRLYIDVVEGLIKKVNSDKKIKPFLHNYPFTVKNLHITISFFEPNIQTNDYYLKSHFVYAILSLENGLNYCGYDIEKKLGKQIFPIHKETYEEALRIVNKEKSAQ